MRKPGPRALDLSIAGFTAQLSRDLEDTCGAGHPDGVTLRQESTRRVHRGRPVTPRRTGVDERTGATGLTEPEVVVVEQLRGGEAVVELYEVEILRTDPR